MNKNLIKKIKNSKIAITGSRIYIIAYNILSRKYWFKE